MRFLLIFLLSVLPQLLLGQYTYFNTHFAPLGGINAGNGVSNQLFVNENHITHVAVYPNFGNYSISFNVQNFEGEFIEQINIYMSGGYLYLNFADALSSHSDGFIYAGAKTDEGAQIRGFNSAMEQIWEILVPLYYDELDQPVYFTNEQTGEFHFSKVLSNGDFIAAGPIIHYNGSEPIYADLWLIRYSIDLEMVWEMKFPFYSENILSDIKPLLRVNDLFELPNGDLLVWGCWLHSWQPMVLRFDSEGNFLTHTNWGSPGPVGALNDWLPWPVQISDEEFVFAYRHGTYQNQFGPQYSKPRVGFFNSTTMTVELLEPLAHEYYGLTITDFEKTLDGGFVMLGYGYDGVTMGFTFMIKLDENGEEVWFKQYIPTIPYHTANGMDLEITPDGGLAFVGNFFELDDEGIGGARNTWVVKTDGCGEEEYNGCAYTVGVNEAITNDKNLKVWPNPATTSLNLEYTGTVATIELTDLYGKKVFSKAVNNEHLFELKIEDLAAGIYVMQLLDINGNSVAQTKVVKQ
jgi:hypothetical protein